jgi:hypothetical protein
MKTSERSASLLALILIFLTSAPAAALLFDGRLDFETGHHRHAVATGDLDNDGNQDLVTADLIGNTVSVLLGNGETVSNWRRGYANITPGSGSVTSWSQSIPALGSLVGINLFSLWAEDVTPVPFNQPPYPPSGDTDRDNCSVTGLKP